MAPWPGGLLLIWRRCDTGQNSEICFCAQDLLAAMALFCMGPHDGPYSSRVKWQEDSKQCPGPEEEEGEEEEEKKKEKGEE